MPGPHGRDFAPPDGCYNGGVKAEERQTSQKIVAADELQPLDYASKPDREKTTWQDRLGAWVLRIALSVFSLIPLYVAIGAGIATFGGRQPVNLLTTAFGLAGIVGFGFCVYGIIRAGNFRSNNQKLH
jgi:hypothetical protein